MKAEQLAMVTMNSTNEEIQEILPELCATGKPFIYHVGDAEEGKDGELYAPLFIAQQASPTGNVTEIEELFLGWKRPLLRMIQNVKPAIAEANGFVEGHVFTNLNIEVTDHAEPQYENHSPRRYGKRDPELEGELITVNGQPVYRQAKLVVGTPNHKVWKRDPEHVDDLSVTQAEDSLDEFID